MKKTISILVAAVLVFALASCGGGGTTNNQKTLFNIDDFVVEYEGFNFITDDDGNDAIAINYKFANNSDAPAQFVWSVLTTYEQNASILSPAIVRISDEPLVYMDDSANDDIQPGVTADVTVTYVLNDKTSPITVTFVCEDFTVQTFKIDLSAAQTAPANGGEPEETPVVNASEEGLLENTQWYGWWMVSSADGEYHDYDGSYFDCCANFEKSEDGYTLLSVWDEVYPDYLEDCVSEIYFEEGDGYLSSYGGFFFTEDDLTGGKVIIDPEFLDFENTLTFMVEVDDEFGSFIALVFLTEWGYEWDEDFADFPTYYDSYFLPLMEEGKALPQNIEDIG